LRTDVVTGDDYCQWETFTAACDSAPDQVVIVQTARYGRMQLGRCIKYDLGFIGCSADVLPLADSMCSGRRRCEIQLPNEAFDRVNPCLSELKSYLTASYTCLKGIDDAFSLPNSQFFHSFPPSLCLISTAELTKI